MKLINEVKQYVGDVELGSKVDLKEHPEVGKAIGTSLVNGAMVGTAVGVAGGLIAIGVCGMGFFKGCLVLWGAEVVGMVGGSATAGIATSINECARLGRESKLKGDIIDVAHKVVG